MLAVVGSVTGRRHGFGVDVHACRDERACTGAPLGHSGPMAAPIGSGCRVTQLAGDGGRTPADPREISRTPWPCATSRSISSVRRSADTARQGSRDSCRQRDETTGSPPVSTRRPRPRPARSSTPGRSDAEMRAAPPGTAPANPVTASPAATPDLPPIAAAHLPAPAAAASSLVPPHTSTIEVL